MPAIRIPDSPARASHARTERGRPSIDRERIQVPNDAPSDASASAAAGRSHANCRSAVFTGRIGFPACNFCISSSKARASGNRSAGFKAQARSTIMFNFSKASRSGNVARSLGRQGKSLWPSPVINSYSTFPKPKTSAEGIPGRSSGIYAVFPTTLGQSSAAMAHRTRPMSANFGTSPAKTIFEGFTSRCTRPRSCRSAKALAKATPSSSA